MRTYHTLNHSTTQVKTTSQINTFAARVSTENTIKQSARKRRHTGDEAVTGKIRAVVTQRQRRQTQECKCIKKNSWVTLLARFQMPRNTTVTTVHTLFYWHDVTGQCMCLVVWSCMHYSAWSSHKAVFTTHVSLYMHVVSYNYKHLSHKFGCSQN